MKIQSSYINLQSTSHKEEQLEMRREKLEEKTPAIQQSFKSPLLNFFDFELEKKRIDAGHSEKIESSQLYEMSEEDYQKVKMLEKILSVLTGKSVKFTMPKKVEVKGNDGKSGQIQTAEKKENKPYMRQSIRYSRTQSMSFEASGTVTTADGKTIDFSLKMARSEAISFSSDRVVDEKGKVVDPLVINYDGNLPNLTQNKYEFDLNFDGTSDQISFISKGSGYLAFDKNEDGIITDGRELFGPSSGDGFGELALYDDDGNGWIDENDRIFDRLKIWNKNEAGEDVLFALGEVGVGAIYLGHVATDYALGNGPMADDGFIRSSGIFLKESGEVGSIQHIDLTL